MDTDIVSLVLIIGLIVSLHFGNLLGSNEPQVSCYFIFGDSFVDSGNNNHLESKWKSNYPPYGVDFPKGHTGRFTNGRTFADIIGQLLGFNEFIPPYANNASDNEISKGVNYASGGAGIREETGIHNGDRVSLDRQLLHHNSTISRISRMQKNTTFLNECIYVINIGSSDYINNYLMTGKYYNTGVTYKQAEYANVLMQHYSRQLKTLYNLGGRKIALFGVTQLGCTPFIIERFASTEGQPCVDIINDCAYVFNNRLKPLVDKLNKDKSDARFTFINTTSILHSQRDANVPSPPSPVPTAIRVTSATTKYRARPCCPIDGDWACIQNSIPSPTRSSSTYFDSVHLTEVSNMALATRAYKALLPTDAYPYDIHRLTQV